MAKIRGDDTNNTLSGTADKDTIKGLGGADSLFGYGGADRLFGGEGGDFLDSGTDTVRDVLNGEDGDDSLAGRVKDELHGGDGTDYFTLYFTDYNKNSVEDFSALTLGGAHSFTNGASMDGMERGIIFFGSGNDTVTLGLMPIQIFAGGGNDVINGGDGNDYIAAGYDAIGDADTINGGAGSDFLAAGHKDKIDGGDGLDSCVVYLDASGLTYNFDLAALESGGVVNLGGGTTLTNVESGTITLGAGDDRVKAGDLPFTIVGGGGADRLIGTGAYNSFEGGDGDDFINGAGGQDKASYTYASAAVAVDLRVSGYQDTGGAGMDKLKGIEVLEGSLHDDQLWGGGGDDQLIGGYGDDLLRGRDGDDYLTGGFSVFTTDDDTLIGGLGQDYLFGGDGADAFVFASLSDSTNAAADYIADLTAIDVIDLSGIDANTGVAGNQAFVLVGSFSGAGGEARLIFDGVLTRLRLDVDGGGVDATIEMQGDQTGHTNFVL